MGSIYKRPVLCGPVCARRDPRPRPKREVVEQGDRTQFENREREIHIKVPETHTMVIITNAA